MDEGPFTLQPESAESAKGKSLCREAGCQEARFITHHVITSSRMTPLNQRVTYGRGSFRSRNLDPAKFTRVVKGTQTNPASSNRRV